MRTRSKHLLGAAVIGLGGLGAGAADAPAEPAPSYHVDATVPLGAPDRWDFVTFDPTSGRVYVAHQDRVAVVDGRTARLLGEVAGIAGGTHGIAIAPRTGTAYTDDGEAGTAIPFDLVTLKTQPPIKVDADADTVAADPASGHIFVIDGDPGKISVIDPATRAVVATIDGGGKLEFAVADGTGHIYVNGEAKREVLSVDTRTNRVTARWPIPACESPHGLAVDPATHRLFVSCENARLMVVNADGGAIVATLPIGRGSDAVVFDAKRKLVLSSNGIDGTLTVIRQKDADTYAPAATIKTLVSGRTMAIDPATGRLFLAAAETDPPTAPGQRAKPRAGTLRLLVLDPR